jgi:hypothetical protein
MTKDTVIVGDDDGEKGADCQGSLMAGASVAEVAQATTSAPI